MDEDESVLPANHPLREYLTSLNLDEDSTVLKADPIPYHRKPPNTSSYRYSWISRFIYCQIQRPKRRILECLLASNHLVEDDQAIMEIYSQMLLSQNSSMTRPYFLAPLSFLLAILVCSFAICLTNVRLSVIVSLGVFSFLTIMQLILPYLTLLLIKNIIEELNNLHWSIKKSILFLQGLVYSQWGLTFAATKMKQKIILPESVFPIFTQTLHRTLVEYMSQASIMSKSVNKIFQKTSIIDLGGCIGELTSEVTTNSEPSLANIKAIFEFVTFLDSEILRRIGCFTSLQVSRSLTLVFHFGRIVVLWLWILRRTRGSLLEICQIRHQLETGRSSTEKPPKKPTPACLENVQSRNHLSCLESLQFHLITWSDRLRVLKERIGQKDPLCEYSGDWASLDLSVMRCLLKNCEICLDEAERTLRPAQPKSKEEEEVSLIAVSSISPNQVVSTQPIDLINDVTPVVEDECLEATVSEQDLQSSHQDTFYTDADFFGQPVSSAMLKEQNVVRGRLLTELNSVIAHRMVETREREMKALRRSRQTGLKPPLKEEDDDEEEEEEEEGKVANVDDDSVVTPLLTITSVDDSVVCDDETDANRRLIRWTESPSSNLALRPPSMSYECPSPESGRGVSTVEVPSHSGRRLPTNPFAVDLKITFLKKERSGTNTLEEIFDDVGTGEHVFEDAPPDSSAHNCSKKTHV